ncbi:hypothetical protein CQW23_17972 [Capsicum baccatum]|uniref:Pentatricopeptide repeat-containing protein n=1 Tax=Capsicum baccatum TaxID=33114 RepID=A0A2G2WFC6_CAPBA|nr:hypothetical protein CQW23_17972 [Capsicum baccatum]
MQLQQMAFASTSARVPEQNFIELQRGKRNRIPSSVLLLQMCRENKEVKQLRGQLILHGLIHHSPNPARLVESYVRVSETADALLVFESSVQSPDTFAYNVMIRGLNLSKRSMESLFLYERLLSDGLLPDSHTYTSVLKACSHLKAVLEVHNNAICPFNSMITGYMNEGLVEEAVEIFNTMVNKDTTTWSAMLSGYVKNGMHEEALLTFRKMMSYKVPLNESSLVCTLSACGELGVLDQGRWIHKYIMNQRDIVMSVNVGTALVDMYAKCGCIEFSYQLFQKMPKRDVVTWGVVISSFATHGQAKKCFQLFDEMIDYGVEPNGVIFVALFLLVLMLCSSKRDVSISIKWYMRSYSEMNLESRCGLSNIQVDGVDHEFRVSDIANDRAQDVYETLGG